MALDGQRLGREIVAAYVREGKLPEDRADDPEIVQSIIIMSEVIVRHLLENAEFNLTGLSVKTTVPGNSYTVDFPAPPGWNPAAPAASVGGTASEVAAVVTGEISLT